MDDVVSFQMLCCLLGFTSFLFTHHYYYMYSFGWLLHILVPFSFCMKWLFVW